MCPETTVSLTTNKNETDVIRRKTDYWMEQNSSFPWFGKG